MDRSKIRNFKAEAEEEKKNDCFDKTDDEKAKKKFVRLKMN